MRSEINSEAQPLNNSTHNRKLSKTYTFGGSFPGAISFLAVFRLRAKESGFEHIACKSVALGLTCVQIA